MAPIPNRGDKRAFFDIKINGEDAGRIVFALWNFTCPKTVENFRVMCTSELGELFGHKATYQGSVFHRVIKGFMIQGGDITRKNGQGGFSIYGPTFDDENLKLKHSRPFLLSMANRGSDTNGSQFFITTAEVPHLDGKHVVFGEVIKGFEVVRMIENLETADGDAPIHKVQVSHCGEMVKKGEQVSPKGGIVEQPEVAGVKMDDEPVTNNWLMRRSRSPEDPDKKKESRRGRDRSSDRYRRRTSRDRNRRDRRSRSRSNNRLTGRVERREERRTEVTKDGIKVRGRGKMTFLGGARRSTTPPHWRREEGKKESLEAHKKKQEEEEERKQRAAIREKKQAAEEARYEKEKKEREFQRELERQKEDARRELQRQESRKRRSRSSESRSRSRSPASESRQENDKGAGSRRSSRRSPTGSSSSRSRSRSSSGSESD